MMVASARSCTLAAAGIATSARWPTATLLPSRTTSPASAMAGASPGHSRAQRNACGSAAVSGPTSTRKSTHEIFIGIPRSFFGFQQGLELAVLVALVDHFAAADRRVHPGV